ncbi:MAG: carboxylesterase family protein [Sphingomonadales bacterium]|nr:carboxylesterase family protein [Sphingomonadales bacterium]
MKAGLLGLAAAASIAAAPGPVIRADHGAVRGVAIERGGAWRGIPFAAPPVGPLRWREARPAKPWHGVRDATRFGATCIQNARDTTLPQSEDCLTLNVATPDRHARGLPVLVSIHGGAFAFGSGRYIADKDLSPVVRAGVVLVSPNYRVGRMGFFAHPALTAEAGHGTGNFWLSDQIAALKWVKANIARFGGDPKRVTILGCSAGGSSVNSLMVSPSARGLFARASAHSGGGLFNAARPLALAEQQGLAFARRANAATLDELRALTPAQVLAADPGPPDFGAIVDGHLLPRAIAPAFAAGRQARVPYLVGSTSNEASVFGLMGFDAAVMRTRFGIDMAALRPPYDALNDAELLRQVQTDFLFTAAAQGLAGFASRHAPTWAYYYDRTAPGEPGAPHCADMAPTFGFGPGHAEPMRAALVNFIKTGNPNGPGVPDWPPSHAGTSSPLVIANEVRAMPGFEAARLEAWYAKWRAENGISARP